MNAALTTMVFFLGPCCPQDAGDAAPQPAEVTRVEAQAAPAHSSTPQSSVAIPDESQAVIRASGIGRRPAGKTPAQAKLMARRAAEVVALRNLAAKLHGQGINDDGDRIEARTEALIRGFRYLPPRELQDGSVEVTVELPLPTLMGNHTIVADRVSQVEEELAAMRAEMRQLREQESVMRAELERTRARIAQLESWIDGHVAELERASQGLEKAAQQMRDAGRAGRGLVRPDDGR
jgi:hypothetical protein